MNRLNERLHAELTIREAALHGFPPDRDLYKRFDMFARDTYRIIAAIRRPWDVSA